MNVQRGVTLLELLVVLVIISVLAALLFPVGASAKRRAKETVCISNLKQIYEAMQLYREDYGEYPFSSSQKVLSQPYLSGTYLRCFAKTNSQVVGDYILNGDDFEQLGTGQLDRTPLMAAFHECREKRGSEFPIAYDANHASIVYGQQGGLRFYLLVREAGNASRIPARTFEDMLGGITKPPCDLHLFVSNL